MTEREDPRKDPRGAAASLFLPALRMDRDPEADVRREGERALELGAGGFLVFGGRAPRVRELVRDLREQAGRPLWVAADLERGAGQQFDGAVHLPPPAALARTSDPVGAARTAGRITGEEAGRLGVDLVLAPVLDLDVEPLNPIVGTRSFGADPERVARLGRAWIEACQGTGVAACGKHFPGHGRTTSDSHLGCPTVSADAELLRREDLAPFREVVPGVASVMTAHVAYPRLVGDPDPPPATMSRELVDGLLRRSLGFEDGLVVTDALVMEGLRGSGDDEGDLAARVIRAGCDLLLYPGDLEAAVEGVARRIEQGDAEIVDRVRESRVRSRRVRRRFVRREVPGDPEERIGGEDEVREALRLAVESVTAVGPGDPTGGLAPARPVAVHAVSDDLDRPGEAPPGPAFARELGSLGWTVERAADASAPSDGRQRVVLLRATPQADKGRAGVSPERARRVSELLDGEGPAALVVFGHERLLRDLGRSGLCAWSAEDVMQRAAARALAGLARGG
ncbi:MAG: glycoside hydrolase family 3 N-terminal domain-containing protein [Candidatus Palauibacterales bacterium]|nr:glycoside hydrolase family 3 N-terminal domain-containing protein [Candidatus Palauibacterales bacterium]